jgi:hypothetical protein
MDETTAQVNDIGQESANTEGDASRESADQSTKKPQRATSELPPEIAEIKRESHKRFDDAARIKKEAEAELQAAKAEREQVRQFIELSQKNPRELERLYGRDKAKKIAEELLFHFYEDEQLTDEQREARTQKEKDQKELEEYRTWKQKESEREAKTKRDAEYTEAAGSIETEIVEVMKNSGLKPTPRTIARIAEQLIAQYDTKNSRNAKDALERVKQDYKQDFTDLFDQMTGEQIAKEYPAIVKKMREYELSQVNKVPSFKTGTTKPQSDSVNGSQKKQTIDDFFKRMGA